MFRVLLGVGDCEVTFVLIKLRGLVDVSVWLAPDDSQFVVTRKARYFLVAHYQTYTPEKVNTILSRGREAVELAEHECDHGGPREEEPAESDFFSD